MDFKELREKFSGDLYADGSVSQQAAIRVYATDASVYQELPLAVALPKHIDDLKLLIQFAINNKVTLIPRAAGTSLAGQVVGKGIVTDISRYFNKVLEINEKEKWVRVQPGMIRDDMNALLKPLGLMFGPETSTSSRAMIGGMIGNNSCGLHSMIWGATRDNLIEVKVLLADGSEALFGPRNIDDIRQKGDINCLEDDIYARLLALLDNTANREAINTGFPQPRVKRRNSGYALDSLLKMAVEDNVINLSALIAGSEGTLCFITEARLKLIDLPPAQAGMVAVHCTTIDESLLANQVAVNHYCSASELVDRVILEQSLKNANQAHNRSFLEGDPGALLMVEFFDDTTIGLQQKCAALITALREKKLGYAYPVLLGADTVKAWDLRKAGLGLLRNLKGDNQPVNLIEDCAVSVEDLPAYIRDVEQLLKKNQLNYSMYAHAGAGELHVEPMINLKIDEGRRTFQRVLWETALLIKKYKGSLSGEHGDGRLRGQYISLVMGENVYELFKEVKNIFDPKAIFNAGKITNTPPMLDNLRFQAHHKVHDLPTLFDFSEQEGMLKLTEKCSGSGDCRKTEVTGGTMCPSYMVTRNEKDTTRARANILRQFLTGPHVAYKNDGTAEMVKDVLDLCMACKGCKIECPSSVDMTKLRAEFLYQYQQVNGIPLRSRLIGQFSRQMRLASYVSPLYNLITQTSWTRKIINTLVGFHPNRSLPALAALTLKSWYNKQPLVNSAGRLVYLFCDEFTNYNDVTTGQKAILLLQRLGYKVVIPQHADSGRALLSKGMLKEAKAIAVQNINTLSGLITDDAPLIGLEPSAILSFRDEYPDLVPGSLQRQARSLAGNTLLLEEFIDSEINKGNISSGSFTAISRKVILHGHCHQKALSNMQAAVNLLSLPVNYKVEVIPSGCCGMAGSFGYEKEHYGISMKTGALILFPAIAEANEHIIIAAAGTSCRHQIKDGTNRQAQHPAEILYDALITV